MAYSGVAAPGIEGTELGSINISPGPVIKRSNSQRTTSESAGNGDSNPTTNSGKVDALIALPEIECNEAYRFSLKTSLASHPEIPLNELLIRYKEDPAPFHYLGKYLIVFWSMIGQLALWALARAFVSRWYALFAVAAFAVERDRLQQAERKARGGVMARAESH